MTFEEKFEFIKNLKIDDISMIFYENGKLEIYLFKKTIDKLNNP